MRYSESQPEAFCDLCGGSPSAILPFGLGWWFRCGSCGMSAVIAAMHDWEGNSAPSGTDSVAELK
jgi:hypothetical protein